MSFSRPARLATLLAVSATLVGASAAQAQAPAGGTAAPTGGAEAFTDGSYALAARPDTLLGRIARFRGSVPTSNAGRTVTIERLDPRTSAWVATATATVGDDGTFIARWRTNTIGRFRVRARVDSGTTAQAATASPEIAVTVYRPAISTWYGPGFYGRRTACGERMTRSLVGVAHRTLPCGTQVALFYKGRTAIVPVVDRGPFRRRTDWDLTAATAKLLDFTFTDRLGAVRLR